jgi:hypothetical protein
MFAEAAFQNEAVGHAPTGPVCWYPGPETWNYGEHDDVLNAGSLAPNDDFLFV